MKIYSYIKQLTKGPVPKSPPKEQLAAVNLELQHKLRQTLRRRQAARQYFFIDIAGTCNLRCPSCPVGNMTSTASKGLMDRDKFSAILDKIERENSGRTFIDLYNWGEPLLHPMVSDFVRETKARGMGCGISTNLNIDTRLRDVVKSGPDYIRISLSGFYNDSYKQTHRGGDINIVKGNMYMLRYWLDRYKSDTVVEIGFHIYRSNFPHDFMRMRELCDELGFVFAPVLAAYMPAEKAAEAISGNPSENDRKLLDNLVLAPALWEKTYNDESIFTPDCQYRKDRTAINFDGSVPLCCAVYEDDKIIARDFTTMPMADIVERKYSHSFCATCMSHGLHQVYTGVPAEGFEKEAIRVLGPLYQAYVDENRQIGDPLHLYYDGRLQSAQHLYDNAMAALQMGDRPAARRILSAIIDEVPEFGEAYYQIGRILWQDGEKDAALAAIRNAVALAPDHNAYTHELKLMEKNAA